MKKFLALMLALVMGLSLVACGNSGSSQTGGTTTDTGDTANTGSADTSAASDYAVAMITDYGDITDQSFNQTTYEACKEYCEANGIEFTYFKPAGDADTERVAMIEKAVDEGYNIIVMPGYAFAAAIVEAAPQYPDVKFVALDVAEGDYLAAVGGDDYYANPGNYSLDKDCDLSNVYTMIYQEELAGYMAGYATVKMGYTKLGFCGGMAVPAVIRYGYGFLQGADAAAAELGVDVSVKYTYANQFYGDADVTAAMDSMYSAGTEVVFACGGGVFTSVAEAAAKVGGKVVGVDVDQAATIDAYGEGMTITSAMKGLAASTKDALKQIVEEDNWSSLAGTIANLGLVSATDPDANFVGIPTGDGTQWSDNFTQDDYAQLVADMYNGVITVSNDTTLAVGDVVSNITVEDLGNIK